MSSSDPKNPEPVHDLLHARRNPLDSIFSPKSIAVIGATEKMGSVGRTVFQNLGRGGFDGVVYPINPKRSSVLCVKTYPSISALPEKIDLAVICTPATSVPAIIQDCVKAGVPGAVIISAGLAYFVARHSVAPQAANESAYNRVMRMGVLRCGYGLWEPGIIRDPNTGQFSGIVYDFMQAVGKSLNIKVEYTLEMPWDSIGVALKSGKIDAHCAGIFATPARGRVMAFSEPMFFSPTVAFARIDDSRFDNNVERINQPDVTTALSDDDITTEIYDTDFPQAKKWNLPQMAPPEELLLAVANHKADVTFNSPGRLRSFERGYPNKIKIIPSSRPLRIFPDSVAVDIDEEQLLHVLNTAIDQQIDSGMMDKILAKYKDKYDVSYIVPVNRPYAWK